MGKKQNALENRIAALEARVAALEAAQRAPEPEPKQGTDWSDPAILTGYETLASLIPRRRFGSIG